MNDLRTYKGITSIETSTCQRKPFFLVFMITTHSVEGYNIVPNLNVYNSLKEGNHTPKTIYTFNQHNN